jgi:hypothetical protein
MIGMTQNNLVFIPFCCLSTAMAIAFFCISKNTCLSNALIWMRSKFLCL